MTLLSTHRMDPAPSSSPPGQGTALPEVSFLVVTYNSARCIRDCFASIRSQTGVSSEIIVVDNASADGTADVIRQSGQDVRFIERRENIGYGPANNQAFAASRGKLLYLFEPDVLFLEPDALARICRTLLANERWGMAGTRIVSASGQEESPPARRYPDQEHVRQDFSRLPGEIAWMIGANMILRREAFGAVGGFDPDFFVYSEDTDLCLRVRQAGFEIGFIPNVTVRHLGGDSERGRDLYDVWRRKMKGLHLFWRKHYSPADVRHLLGRDRRRAGFRMRWYGVLARFQPPKSVAWQKHRQYRAIWEASLATDPGR